MPNPYRIVDLQSYTLLPGGLPSGAELLEISTAGTGSYQVPVNILLFSRAPIILSAGGTYNLLSSNYSDLIINTTSALTINLPGAGVRGGAPAGIADISGAPNVTIVPNGADLIVGLSHINLNTPYGGFTLWPLSGTGWYQK